MLDRVEREMGLENGQLTAPYPESNLNLVPEMLTEVLPEASSSLLRYKKLLRPRLSESDVTIEDSQRQESSSHDASLPSSFVPEVPTSAETRGKVQEALSQVVQEGEALETRLKEMLQGGETSTGLLQLEAEISTLNGKLRGAEEAREKQEEEIIQAKLKNSKMLVKRKTHTDHRGSPTRNLLS